jgi:hypothetical protein
MGIPIQNFVWKIPIVSWDPLRVARDLWSDWSYQVCNEGHPHSPSSRAAAIALGVKFRMTF